MYCKARKQMMSYWPSSHDNNAAIGIQNNAKKCPD